MADDPAADARDELRAQVRIEELRLDSTVALRGGPDSIDKIRRHATRTHRAFMLDGQPVYGISVFCAMDDIGPASLDGLLRTRLTTYRWVHTPTVQQLAEAGFTLLSTFGRPHYTLVLGSIANDELEKLEVALGSPSENPYHQRGRSGR
jgi:hypothetical protein